MGFQDYIGEAEACSFAGVSAATLRRFAEAGYFQIETDSDGLRLFSKSEIESLFGLKPITAHRPKSSPPPNPSAATTPVTPTPSAALSSRIEIAVETTATPFELEPKFAATVVRAPVETMAPHTAPPVAIADTGKVDIAPVTEEPSNRSAALEAVEREVTKLQNIVALQEKLLELREEELRSIKGERDWLRSRIEKLEEKNERDQLLLLAETQTVRQLINLQNRKRSTVQLALEWLGLKSPQAAPGQPIDISPSAPATRAEQNG
jgi:hypothetical protein